jgi:hypothetical protein
MSQYQSQLINSATKTIVVPFQGYKSGTLSPNFGAARPGHVASLVEPGRTIITIFTPEGVGFLLLGLPNLICGYDAASGLAIPLMLAEDKVKPGVLAHTKPQSRSSIHFL